MFVFTKQCVINIDRQNVRTHNTGVEGPVGGTGQAKDICNKLKVPGDVNNAGAYYRDVNLYEVIGGIFNLLIVFLEGFLIRISKRNVLVGVTKVSNSSHKHL